MKNFNFIYVEVSRVYSRTYGGSDYKLKVYDISCGVLNEVCGVKACTRGHRGEQSEAWRQLLLSRPDLLKLLKRRAKVAGVDLDLNYWSYRFEKLGVTLVAA